MTDKIKHPFTGVCDPSPKPLSPADIQKCFAEGKRMEKVVVIREMLSHFKQKHDNTNHALYTTGEGKRCKPFESIKVEDIKSYIESMSFDEEI